MKALHLLNRYLAPTENWIYQLIKNAPGVRNYIGALAFIPNEFLNDSDFVYLPHIAGGREAESNATPLTSPRNLLKKARLRLGLIWKGDYESYLINTFKNDKPDVVHAHFAPRGWRFRKLAGRLKVPYVVSFYGYDYERLPFERPEYRERYRKLFKIADQFLCEGAHGVNILSEMGCPGDKIAIVRLGVDIDQIPFLRRTKIKDQLRLVQIATLTEKKGHLYTIRAFAEALKTCPEMTLTLAGKEKGAGLKAALQREIAELGITGRVTWFDQVDYASLYAFLSRFDVFIHPSCYAADRDCEGGAPIVLLDAQAIGLPVISTLHCDIPEEVVQGETGLLSAEKDVAGLAESIRFFYGLDDAGYQPWSLAARRHVETNYDAKKSGLQLKAVYQSLQK